MLKGGKDGLVFRAFAAPAKDPGSMSRACRAAQSDHNSSPWGSSSSWHQAPRWISMQTKHSDPGRKRKKIFKRIAVKSGRRCCASLICKGTDG